MMIVEHTYLYSCDSCGKRRSVRTAHNTKELSEKLPKGWLDQVERIATKTGGKSKKSLVTKTYCPDCKAEARKSVFRYYSIPGRVGRYNGH